MKRSDKRILTTHVGSLIRPPELLEFITAAQKGEPYDKAAYEACLKDAVATAVREQAQAGVDIVNDGEFGKSSWAAYVLERINGFEVRRDQIIPLNWLGRDRERFREFFEVEMPNSLRGAPAEVCVGPITMRDTETIKRDIANLKAGLAGARVEEAFFTTVAPASTAYNGINEYYPTEEEYVYAIADALRSEYQAVYESGLLLQVDDAVLANMYDYLVSTSPEHYQKWAQLRVDALNHALKGIPEDRIRYHICFGSWHVPHVADAPLSEMIDLILQVNAGAYSFEAANPRHEHEWTIWENTKLAEGKSIIPGVVTHHTTVVEHPDLVAQRIVRFARLVGRENVIAGTDCGFAQGQGVQRVHPSVMWAKLEALAEGARIASRQLWA
ncbi:MAG TPA: cobalamin-independent methionine synthase II family protein [Dehalococcoidia bacterium]|jgi:5-methyltetrahydropteroyltriglutamate--homocysteine methyltransferase|nr:cobalamin-independent methionine synthase II family protein [Dehalococcoidia bacterium]